MKHSLQPHRLTLRSQMVKMAASLKGDTASRPVHMASVYLIHDERHAVHVTGGYPEASGGAE